MANKKTMASTAKKSAKEEYAEKKAAIVKLIRERMPEMPKGFGMQKAIVVSMAAGLLAATTMDECGKAAVQDMAHELSYDWDPFTGDFA